MQRPQSASKGPDPRSEIKELRDKRMSLEKQTQKMEDDVRKIKEVVKKEMD